MPQPQFQRVELNEVVESVVRLFQAQLRAPERAAIECRLELADGYAADCCRSRSCCTGRFRIWC